MIATGKEVTSVVVKVASYALIVLVIFVGGNWVMRHAAEAGAEQARVYNAAHPIPPIQHIQCAPTPARDEGACSISSQRAGFHSCFETCLDAHRRIVSWHIDRDGATCQCSDFEVHVGP